jgi:hypothetical protein
MDVNAGERDIWDWLLTEVEQIRQNPRDRAR